MFAISNNNRSCRNDSKVIENIVCNQLVNFFERENILSVRQFSFRGFLGTQDLLTALNAKWLDTLNEGTIVRILAVGIAGAFDRYRIRV